MSRRRDIDRANQHIDEAWDAHEHAPDTARLLAIRALEIEPDLFDGYVLLSLVAGSNIEQTAFAREGFRRGKIHFHASMKRPTQSQIWHQQEGRPFFRCMYRLAGFSGETPIADTQNTVFGVANGSEQQAYNYAVQSLDAWLKIPDAIKWLNSGIN